MKRNPKEKKEFEDKKININKLNSVWLAGVIDGEGSIGLYNYGKEGRRVLIQVSNTNKEFIKKIRKIIGCGSSIIRTDFSSNNKNHHKGRKPIYHYALKGSIRCYWILKQILQYLIIKKQKALDIVKEIETKPFGRWKNCTEEKRKLQSILMKKSWQDPIIRLNRIEGIRNYYRERGNKM